MAFYIFIQGKSPHAEWELLEKVERSDLAKEVYLNYQRRTSAQVDTKIAMVSAINMIEGIAVLNRQATPMSRA